MSYTSAILSESLIHSELMGLRMSLPVETRVSE